MQNFTSYVSGKKCPASEEVTGSSVRNGVSNRSLLEIQQIQVDMMNEMMKKMEPKQKAV